MSTHEMPETEQDATQWWEDFYRENSGRWSGRPNASLVEEVAGLTPGAAMDLGCGQGADAIWLAQQGWRVTGVDISSVALATAARDAQAAGLAPDAIAWEQRELGVDPLPAGRFDLVTASFLHSPVELPRTRVLREAAEAVAPGGSLLVVGHMPSESHPHVELPAPEQVVAELALSEDRWALRTCATRELQHAFRDETPHSRVDGVIRYERLKR